MTGLWIDPNTSIISSNREYYRVIRHIGTGGNSIAFFVLCTSGVNRGQFFSLKLQYNIVDEKRIVRFLQEVDFLKQQDHVSIVQHYDDGDYRFPNGNIYPFVVTSYLPYTLADYMGNPELTLEKKVRFSCQLLSALQWLKNQSILHRDIKPQNIFVNGDNVVLGDFGLIKRLDDEAPAIEDFDDDLRAISSSVLFDAAGYIAMPKFYRTPELVEYANQRDILHIESDVFQLGLVLAEMFTGINPLVPNPNLYTKIYLSKLPFIGEGVLKHIRKLLCGMLELDYKKRFTIDALLDGFTGVYQNIVFYNS